MEHQIPRNFKILNSDNWDTWVTSVRSQLGLRGALKVITGEQQAPVKQEPGDLADYLKKKEEWEQTNFLARSILEAMISNKLNVTLGREESTQVCWEILRDRCYSGYHSQYTTIQQIINY